MKPIKAWAIIDSNGKIALYDHRLPLCWNRRVAKEDAVDHGFYAKVVRVEIREVPAPKRRGR